MEAIGVITERGGWFEAVVDRFDTATLPFERWPWGRTPPVDGRPYRVLLADAGEFPDCGRAVLSELAGHAWQASTVVSLTRAPGAADLLSNLRRLGFQRIVMERDRSAYWKALCRSLEAVLRGDAWLLPVFCRVLRCTDARLVRALATLLDPLPCGRTVTHWARSAGFRRRQELAALCTELGLPHPKVMLDAIRIARAAHAALRRPDSTRDQLARRFGFSSGDYMGKRARALTGCSFGQLIHVGPATVVARVVTPA